jgi:glycerate kinase
MKILIAPDKFKGSLGAPEVAQNIAKGLRDTLRDAKIDIVPMADGGEGTAEVICEARGGSWFRCKAHDPLGREIEARYAWIDPPSPRLRRDRGKLAVMEMSEVAGMRRLSRNERDPFRATTFGVGEMILDASRRGAQEIIIGLGGSATNDGGFGMARALGFQFFSEEQPDAQKSRGQPGKLDWFNQSGLRVRELKGVVSDLEKLTRIATPSPGAARSPSRSCAEAGPPFPEGEDGGEGNSRDLVHLSLPRIIAAADVRNPLLGENGATHVFGPQKGATPDRIDTLERALAKLADVVLKDLQVDYRNEPGAGAAGGLGFGLMSFCGAKIRPGFSVVSEAVGLESKIKAVDFVITGEGSLDRQTLEGKTPAGVARLARKLGKRVFAIVGRASDDREVREIFDAVYVLSRPGLSEAEQMAHAAGFLREKAGELGEFLKKTFNA